MMMQRVTYDPFYLFENPIRMLEKINRSFGADSIAGVYPLLNLSEDKDKYFIKAELPGINAADLEISATHNTVSISGKRTNDIESEGSNYHRKEREGGTFSRMITLPDTIDSNKVDARLKDGILSITLPKSEKIKPRSVKIDCEDSKPRIAEALNRSRMKKVVDLERVKSKLKSAQIGFPDWLKEKLRFKKAS